MNKNKVIRSRYWTIVTYQENMREDWKDVCSDLFDMSFYYSSVHDKDNISFYYTVHDKDKLTKSHVHWILVFPNITTQKFATSFFDRLSKDGCKCYSGYAQPLKLEYLNKHKVDLMLNI